MAGSKVHKALTDLNIRQLKYDPDKGGKYQYHADGGGLTIKVTSNNSKLWQLSYRLNGKQYHISLGAYPSVSLAQARAKREQIKALLAQGIDPRENTSKPAILFEEILNKWFEHVKDNIRESSNYSYSLLAKNYILPTLGKKPIDTITKKDLADLCENAKSNGKTIPGYLACLLKMIFNYAEDTGNIEINPASSLTRLFKQVKAEKGFAAQTEINDIRENLQKIQSYCNNSNIYLAPQVKLILQILPFVGLRNMALRQLKWENIDLETGQVNIDAIEGNKTKVGYSIYLGSKTLQLIKDYKKLGLDNEYIFPAIVKKNVPLNKSHVRNHLGFAGINPSLQTPHGFRKVLKTLIMSLKPCEELEYLTEKTLGHKVKDIKVVYNLNDYKEHYKKFWQYVEDLLIAVRDNLTIPKWDDYK